MNSRSALIQMCADEGVKDGGTKHDMATRLVLVRSGIIQSRSKVIDSIRREVPKIVLEELEDGDFWFPPLGLVFDKATRRVVCARDRESGSRRPLSLEDLLQCQYWKLPYTLPEGFVFPPCEKPTIEVATESPPDESSDNEEADVDDIAAS